MFNTKILPPWPVFHSWYFRSWHWDSPVLKQDWKSDYDDSHRAQTVCAAGERSACFLIVLMTQAMISIFLKVIPKDVSDFHTGVLVEKRPRIHVA
ncbi:MAG: hypothetical protein K2Y39_00460 [Candidatus Obscuribacterales bacterium]|nr:hypothetical protein [Candidatus Obscuribacterales bacterium]